VYGKVLFIYLLYKSYTEYRNERERRQSEERNQQIIHVHDVRKVTSASGKRSRPSLTIVQSCTRPAVRTSVYLTALQLGIAIPDLNFHPGIRDCRIPNPGIPGSRRDWRSIVKTNKIGTWVTVFGSLFLNYKCVRSCYGFIHSFIHLFVSGNMAHRVNTQRDNQTDRQTGE